MKNKTIKEINFENEAEVIKFCEGEINKMNDSNRIKFLYRAISDHCDRYNCSSNRILWEIFDRIYNAATTLFYATVNIRIKNKKSFVIDGKDFTTSDLEAMLKEVFFEIHKLNFAHEVFQNVQQIIKNRNINPDILLVHHEDNILNPRNFNN